MKLISSLAMAILAACAALADETRVSVRYGTIDQGIRLPSIPDPVLLFTFNEAETNGRGYQVQVEGDEADFLYSLNYSRHGVSGTIPTQLTVLGQTNQLESDFEYDIERVGGTLGWHGLKLGGFGFGPVVSYSRTTVSSTKLVIDGSQTLRNTDAVFGFGSERTVLGALMRNESDLFDFSVSAGTIVQGDAWKHGLALSIEADIHVSDAVTLTGDWTRAWGKQAVFHFVNESRTIDAIRETEADAFGLGGRLKVADRAFLEGRMTRARNGTNIQFGRGSWSTTLNVGVGMSF